MRFLIFLSLIVLSACHNNEPTETTVKKADTPKTTTDTVEVPKEAEPEPALPKKYSNARFRDVTVESTGQDTYRVRGQGQIFEANFSWVVEDGHEELKKGFQMTDAGAPEWGNFEFVLNVLKKRKNSALTLILFESSPKDGSRQHELSIPLD